MSNVLGCGNKQDKWTKRVTELINTLFETRDETVHYDNTEKVIGTWFNETLYERSYHFTGTINAHEWTTLDSSRLPSNTPYFAVTNVCFMSTELSSSAKLSAYTTNIPFDIAISTGEQLYFENKSNYKIYEFSVTVQYTKTSS